MLDCDLSLDSRFELEHFRRRVLQIGDTVAICAAFPLAALLSPSGNFPLALQADPASALVALGGAICAALSVLHFTRMHTGFTWFDRVQQISLSLGTVFLLEAFLGYAGFPVLLDVGEMAMGSALCAALLLIWYLAFRLIFADFPPRPRVLLLGSDPVFPEIWGFLMAGAGGAHLLGPVPFPTDLRAMANELTPDEIVVGDVSASGAFPANALLDLRFRGVTVFDAASYCEDVLQRISLRHLRPARLLYGEISPKRKNLALQAIYSNLFGLMALAAVSPILAVAAIALKISSPARGLMEPCRMAGLNGIAFDQLRFQSRSGLGPWLAKTGLGGLPQLFNVVRGEMSLVGPRPNRVEFHEALSRQLPFYSQRLAVRPGLTGWAQIHRTGGDATVELEYDLYYIKHVSPGFDIDILIASILGRKAD